MGLQVITAPQEEPITLDEAKVHLNQTEADDDPLITRLIKMATVRAENIMDRALITQTLDWSVDGFASCFRVPRPPLQSVTSINYIDTAGTSQLLASTQYKVDAVSQPGRITEAYGVTWPNTRNEMNAVTIRFLAGYGDESAVPDDIKAALLMLVGHWYENREATSEVSIYPVPFAVDDILLSYAVW